ncbi:hypothetical protein JL102_00095 [Fulvivirga sp. 2943]|uniref:Uncharacterized protein n=2 Tax=Fulvivirga sediminis TaxID=2803949 RepID=A0A937F1F7_9BACT|nr:hypothetical protein [Fulvivirga sediminis]
MKHLTIISFFTFINFLYANGQNTSFKSDWEQILISDVSLGEFTFKKDYILLRNNLSLTTPERPDSVIKEIRRSLIDSLILSLKNHSHVIQNPLLMFNRDSLWLINNAEKLWSEYDVEERSEEIDSIAIQAIKNYSNNKRFIWGLTLPNQYHYNDVFVNIKIITRTDTLSISSIKNKPYMLPWEVNGKRIYNSNISRFIAEILPKSQYSNKSKLLGVGFNDFLIKALYHTVIEKEIRFHNIKKTYKKEFRYINNFFQVEKAQFGDMASIEWGGWFGRPCIELTMTDSSLSDQLQFSIISGKHSLMSTFRSLKRNKDKLINQLRNNPVYQYLIECDECLGEIHWVQDQSLSGEAKSAFFDDLKQNDKGKFKRQFSKAIFFELTERRNKERSFSRWIFLKDGTIILWEIEGGFLMDLPDYIIRDKGYITEIIKRSDFAHK